MSIIIVQCDCGQKNRMPDPIPAGKTVRCGACHVDISDLDESSLTVGAPIDDADDFDGDDDDN